MRARRFHSSTSSTWSSTCASIVRHPPRRRGDASTARKGAGIRTETDRSSSSKPCPGAGIGKAVYSAQHDSIMKPLWTGWRATWRVGTSLPSTTTLTDEPLSPPATPGARLALRECPQRHLTSTSSSQVPARSVVPSAVKVMVAGLLSVQ